ncbi:MAG: precorrin-8X methylmutase [Lachnospiraceae bacterium]
MTRQQHYKTTDFAMGDAPTALVRLYELIEDGKLQPELIIRVQQDK